MKKIISLVVVSLGIAACAPAPEKAPTPEIKFEFGPTNSDAALDLSKVKEKTQASQNQWLASASLSPQGKLDFAENILALGQSFDLSDLKSSAVQSIRNFRSHYQPQTIAFEDSPYVDAIVGSTANEAKQQVTDAQKFLPEDEQKLRQFLTESKTSYVWPKGPASSDQSLKSVDDYLQFLINHLAGLGLNPIVLENLKSELPVRVNKSLTEIRAELVKVQAAKTSTDVIDQIQQMITTLQFSIAKDTQALLNQGKSLARTNLAAKDEQDILTVLVQIFRMLEPKDRQELIASESPDLYNFLNDASPDRLKCLETRGCKRDLIVWIGKKTKIFPQLETRGVSNLREKINTSMKAYVLTRLDDEVLLAIQTIPDMIADQIGQAFKEKLAEIAGIKDDYPGYVKKIAKNWAALKLTSNQGRVLGLEQLNNVAGPGESTSTLLGEALLVKTRILNQESNQLDSQEKIQWSIEHLNKLLALGGYKKNEVESIRAMAQPIDIHFSDMKLSLQEILKSNFSFAVPDKVSLVSAYTSKVINPSDFNVSVVGQARLLRGYSESIQFLKDWQATAFDPILGKDKIVDAFPAAPASIAQQKLFPKDTLFAVSVGNAAIILKNLLKDLTPVFVVGQESQIIWANNFDVSSADAVSMAGVVNLIAGQRDLKVSSADLSEYMVALGDFVRAMEGIENTKSSYLQDRGADGRRNVDELLDAKKQVKILMVGLGNFLSNRMVSTTGWVRESYSLRRGQIEDTEMKVMTQFKAIESLLQAYEITKLSPYLWSALDLYYKLNKEVFNAQTGFYNGITTLEQGAQVLKILKGLQPYLPVSSQSQLESLLHSWTGLIQARLK